MTNNKVALGKYVNFSHSETIETITAYSNSKHISGDTDSLGREKPFFNVVTAAVNIWYRATDLDRKDVTITPSKANHTVLAFVATILLQQWMKREKFGMFLNDWGRTLAQYGSAVTKFVEKNGELHAYIPAWDHLIVDPVNFDALPTIEKIDYTPEDLKKNKLYDQDMVEKLIEGRGTRETLGDSKVDNTDNFITIYEIHGELPLSFLTENEEDEQEYVQQMHIVAYNTSESGEHDDFTLYKGKETKHPYLITHLIPEKGRTLSIGAVEYLFDAQWMQNHSMKNMKDALDVASRLIMQTADKRFAGRNVLSAIESGQIMVHDDNKPLTLVNNTAHDTSSLINFQNQWRNLASEITSTPDALRGNTLPSGTPYSLGAFLGGQALSLFEIMTENKGLYLEQMLREYIIPHIKKKMNTTEEIAAVLEDRDVKKLDSMYIPKEAIKRFNRRTVDEILQGNIPSPFQKELEEQAIQQELSILGNTRFLAPSEIKTKEWAELMKDLEWEVDVGITNENMDKQVVLTTLSTVLQTIVGNPQVLQDPNAKLVFNKILQQVQAVSPAELSATQTQPQSIPQETTKQLGRVAELQAQ